MLSNLRTSGDITTSSSGSNPPPPIPPTDDKTEDAPTWGGTISGVREHGVVYVCIINWFCRRLMQV